MNDEPLKEFEAHLASVIDSIAASPGRKRIMREDLLTHLLDSYLAETGRRVDEAAAGQAAIKRLGSPDEIRQQLQASVPIFERVLFLCLNPKETFMWRWLWVIGVVAILVGDNFHFSQSEQVFFGGVVLIGGLVFRHLIQKNNFASRLIGTRWPWLVGSVAVLFGTAWVLPAMAKMKHEGAFSVIEIEFLTAGALITLGGLGFIARAVKTHIARPV